LLVNDPRVSRLAGFLSYYASLSKEQSNQVPMLLVRNDTVSALPEWLQKGLADVAKALASDSNVAKHLLGQHDQSTHGHGKSSIRPYELKPATKEGIRPPDYLNFSQAWMDNGKYGELDRPLFTTAESSDFYTPENDATRLAKHLAVVNSAVMPNGSNDEYDEANSKLKQTILGDKNYPMPPIDELNAVLQTREYRDTPATSFAELDDYEKNKTLMVWIAKNPEKGQAYVERENKFVLEKIREQKMADGNTVGQVLDDMSNKALAQLKAETIGTDISLTMPATRLKKFLSDERYKTVHEVSSPSKGASRAKYIEAREVIETDMMGVPYNVPKEQRPVYGVLGTQGVLYGDTRIVLKDDVKHRTTVSIGDSADDRVKGVFWASDLAESKVTPTQFLDATAERIALTTANSRNSPYFSYESKNFNETISGYNGLKDVRDIAGYHYIETQIHGGVKLSDVKEIIVPPDFAISKPMQTKLDASGIQVSRAESNWSAD